MPAWQPRAHETVDESIHWRQRSSQPRLQLGRRRLDGARRASPGRLRPPAARRAGRRAQSAPPPLVPVRNGGGVEVGVDQITHRAEEGALVAPRVENVGDAHAEAAW